MFLSFCGGGYRQASHERGGSKGHHPTAGEARLPNRSAPRTARRRDRPWHVRCSAVSVRILWVKAGKLLPVDTGGKIRSFNILKQLAVRHDVTLLS